MAVGAPQSAPRSAYKLFCPMRQIVGHVDRCTPSPRDRIARKDGRSRRPWLGDEFARGRAWNCGIVRGFQAPQGAAKTTEEPVPR